MGENLKKAVFAGGCFWCMESDFVKCDGVKEVVSGYMGGHVKNPTYEEVCSGKSGHLEVVEITYDESIICFKELLDIYFKHVDPTDKGGQFVDRGSQYRPAIFYTSQEEKTLAGDMVKEIEAKKIFKNPIVVGEDGMPVNANEGGYICIKKPWPGLMRTLYGDHDRFVSTYFSQYKNPDTGLPMYMTGDGGRFDEDGYYWIMGRIDDVLKVSGHRLGTAEIESALVKHPTVAESAVVGFPHEIKGESIYVFVTLKLGVEKSDDLKQELRLHVRREIGPIATPEKIQFADALPKTRSGKIMRRILKRIAADKIDEIGDTSTLADPTVVETLVRERIK